MIPFYEIRQQVQKAEATIRQANELASELARLLDGRCQHVKDWAGRCALARIKKQLGDFNAQTKTWKGGAK